MILNLGPAVATAYVYLKDSRSEFKTANLIYDLGKGPVTISDTTFPWEFTVPLKANTDRFSFKISGTTPDGELVASKQYVLRRK